jgi:VCBS repeat-containing protein
VVKILLGKLMNSLQYKSIFQFIGFLLFSLLIVSKAQAEDANFQELDFSDNPQLISGTDKALNAEYLYTNIITIGGVQVDAIVKIAGIYNGATIIEFDDNGSSSTDNYFAPQIRGNSSNSNARVDFLIRFVDDTSARNTIEIENFNVNSIDIDGPEFVEYGGFDSYTLSTNTDLQINSGGGNRIRFTGTDNYSGLLINDEGRVETTFGAVSSLEITMGVASSSSTRMFGSAFKAFNFSGSTSTILAPTVNIQSTVDTTPTITGELVALSGSDSFEVVVNSVSYTDGDGHLTVSGTSWSLTIPGSNNLSPGTYSVTATRKGTIDLPDQSSNELTIITPPSNTAPVAVADSYTVTEGGTLNGTTVLTNDTDIDSNTLTAVLVSDVSNGTLTLNTNGSFSYVHDGSETTSDNFTYKANDSTVDSNTVTVSITVTNVNDAPVALGQSVTTLEETAKTITLSGTDADSDTLSFNSVSTPSNGTLSGTAPNLTYTPAANFTGSDSFTFKVNDGTVDSTTATITINVTNVNDAPVANDQLVTTPEDIAVQFMLVGSDADEQTLTYTVTTVPNNGMLVVNNNQLTYTPNTDYFGTDTLTFMVSDGELDSNIGTVTINVTPVNDEPIDQNESITITNPNDVSIIDVITNAIDPDGDELSVVSASSEHGTVIINDDGTLSFIPDEGFTGETTITYTISDGNGGTYTAEVTVTVAETNLPPQANDDSFTLDIASSYTLDVLANDSDPEGDPLTIINAVSDFGSVTIVDNQLSFAPLDNASGELVLSYVVSDGINEGVSAQVFVNMNGGVGPIITLPDDICEENTVNASALYTSVDLGQASAVDRFGNALPVSLMNNATLFPPGKNEAIWQATDLEGNTTLAIQYVCVTPLISINKDQTTLEGQTVTVGVYLNGTAPVYPVTIPYTVSGTADTDDHDLVSGEVVIASGSEAKIVFDTFADSVVEANETVVIRLDAMLNVGSKFEHHATITESNIAPEIALMVSQAGQNRLTVSQSQGMVNITAKVFEPNINDLLTYEWSSVGAELENTSSTDPLFIFDPVDLSPGLYTVTLQVTDDGLGLLSDIETVYIEVVDVLAVLGSIDSDGDLIPDNLEGFQDSDGDGIADYLDRIMECNVLPENVAKQDGYLIEGDAGVCLRRGDFTIGKETGGAELTQNDIVQDEQDVLVADPDATNIGGIFDYIAYGLPDNGTTFGIVIPQRRPIPINAVYRKFSVDSGWGFFVEDEFNSIWSTQGEPGYCPPPNTDINQTQWTAGLQPDHWCVQLIIQDGGPNDNDNIANGTIVDPGGVGVMLNNNQPPVATSDTAQLFINSDVVIDVLANDYDPDNDDLTLSSATVSIGSVIIDNNELIYTAPPLYIGQITITYGVKDDNGGTDQATVIVDILPNLAPSLSNYSSQIIQGERVDINLLSQATDPENDVLTLVSTNNPNVTFTADGLATFSPNADFYGTQTITFTIEDAVGNQSEAQWQITVIQLFQSQAKTTGGSVSVLFAMLLCVLIVFRKIGNISSMITSFLKLVSQSFVPASLTAMVIGSAMVMSAQVQAETQASDNVSEQSVDCSVVESTYESCDTHLGWFVGGEIGLGDTSISGSDLDVFYQNTGINAQSLSIDNKDTGGGLFLGYQFSSYFSLAAGYINLGERDVVFSGSATDLLSYYDNAEDVYPQSAKGWSINANAAYPLSENLKIAAKLGYWDWEGDYLTSDGANNVGQATLTGKDVWMGLELNYRWDDNLQLYAGVSRFKLARDTNHLYSLGARYYWADNKPKHVKKAVPAVALDSDADGVLDSNDQCVDTPITHRVDELGCSLMIAKDLTHTLVIYFDNDSTVIAQQYHEEIEAMVEFVKAYSIDTISVNGHTSSVGSTLYNQTLSIKRAQALANYLIAEYTLPETLFNVQGFGETQLIDIADTLDTHKLNRRIEINIQATILVPVLAPILR